MSTNENGEFQKFRLENNHGLIEESMKKRSENIKAKKRYIVNGVAFINEITHEFLNLFVTFLMESPEILKAICFSGRKKELHFEFA